MTKVVSGRLRVNIQKKKFNKLMSTQVSGTYHIGKKRTWLLTYTNYRSTGRA